MRRFQAHRKRWGRLNGPNPGEDIPSAAFNGVTVRKIRFTQAVRQDLNLALQLPRPGPAIPAFAQMPLHFPPIPGGELAVEKPKQSLVIEVCLQHDLSE